jgi:uncharacterized protein
MAKRLLYWTVGSVAALLVVIGAVAMLGIVDVVTLIVGALSRSPRIAGGVALGVGAAALTIIGRRTSWRIGRANVALVFGCVAIGVAVLGATGVGRSWREDAVRFKAGDATLVATLYTPRRGSPPYPAVVIVPGSAPFRRGFYAPWADYLAARGFVVLMPDKRGVGSSGGEFERENNSSLANLTLLAHDAIAGVAFLADRSEVDRSRIGLVGLSQAGWVVPIAVAAADRIAYFALISGPAVSVHEEGVWSRLRGDDHDEALASFAAAHAIVDTVTPGGVDARAMLGSVNRPGLWLFGADDNSIPSKKSSRILDSLSALGKPFTHRSFDGYGHLVIGRGAGEWLLAISRPSMDTLAAWLEATAR